MHLPSQNPIQDYKIKMKLNLFVIFKHDIRFKRRQKKEVGDFFSQAKAGDTTNLDAKKTQHAWSNAYKLTCISVYSCSQIIVSEWRYKCL
jgi:hypothetical protein